jgi:tripartite-type tricarboxylate transporter receptor subunit TctC
VQNILVFNGSDRAIGGRAIRSSRGQRVAVNAAPINLHKMIWEDAVKLRRRAFLQLAAGAAALPFAPYVARAQAYPTRPVRIIVGFAAGGPTDITARVIAQYLSERMGQSFIVENRPGASSTIATPSVVSSAADGYTLILLGVWETINATLYSNLKYNFANDIAPVAGLIRYSNVMEVPSSLPVKSVSEFISYVRANPGKVNMASPGIGTSQHVSGELFNMMTGLKVPAIQYRGSGPALTDLIGGQVQVMFDAIPSSVGHIRDGRLRALAVTAASQSEALPEIQTMANFVPGYEASGWNGIGAPRGTPREIIEKLNSAINAGLADPTLKARFSELGGTGLTGSPAELGKLIVAETEKWGKFANMKPE